MRNEGQKSEKQGRGRKVILTIGGTMQEPEAETHPLRKLVAEAAARATRERERKIEAEKKKRPPNVFTQGMVHLSAGKRKLTPRQLVRHALLQEEIKEAPDDVRNWYAKIAGDFSKPPLVNLLEEIYRYALSKDEQVKIEGLREAVFSGNIKWLEDLTSCVAFIHRIPYAGNGQARRVAGATARNVVLTFTRLFESRNERPSASEIRVEMARHACDLEAKGKPRFSDVWYLLRSGSKDDDEPGPSSRYEVTGIKNIKKTLKLLKITAGPPLRGPLTAKKVKAILDKWELNYVDDLGMVPEILK
ncbi:MAG: hypothetical protein LV479_07135 [Methylacidiphilales bacterium]|nr:hypothetical protein [Candidatus Methylacidiphilales bacterium]